MAKAPLGCGEAPPWPHTPGMPAPRRTGSAPGGTSRLVAWTARLAEGKPARRHCAFGKECPHLLKERVLKRIFPASIVASLLVACGCSMAVGRDAHLIAHPNAATRVASESPTALARRIGAICRNDGEHLRCITGKVGVGDYLDVTLQPSCDTRAIVTKKAELRDRAAPLDRRTVAVLDRNQTMCIQAIGLAGDHPEYYYVATVSEAPLVADGEPLEVSHPAIHWIDPRVEDCSPVLLASGRRRCASGWIDAGSVRVIRRPG